MASDLLRVAHGCHATVGCRDAAHGGGGGDAARAHADRVRVRERSERSRERRRERRRKRKRKMRSERRWERGEGMIPEQYPLSGVDRGAVCGRYVPCTSIDNTRVGPTV